MPFEESVVPSNLGVLLRLGHQHFSSAVEVELAAAGFADLKPHYANVFTFVPPEGIQVSELTVKAGVRKQSMAQVVEELEKLGYVERRPHPTDRRARLVFITERGAGVRPLAMAAGRKVEAEWASLMGEEDFEVLRSGLRRLLALVQEG